MLVSVHTMLQAMFLSTSADQVADVCEELKYVLKESYSLRTNIFISSLHYWASLELQKAVEFCLKPVV
jgi:hypothetical protein